MLHRLPRNISNATSTIIQRNMLATSLKNVISMTALANAACRNHIMNCMFLALGQSLLASGFSTETTRSKSVTPSASGEVVTKRIAVVGAGVSDAAFVYLFRENRFFSLQGIYSQQFCPLRFSGRWEVIRSHHGNGSIWCTSIVRKYLT